MADLNFNTNMVKFEVFIPVDCLENLRQALRSAGAGTFGNYDSVLSYSSVRGCWRPLPGANPFDGEVGVLCERDEYKVEVCCRAENLKNAVSAIKAAHPYEEPVINIITLGACSESPF